MALSLALPLGACTVITTPPPADYTPPAAEQAPVAEVAEPPPPLPEYEQEVNFTQNYQSDSFSDQVEKVLDLRENSGDWRSARQSVKCVPAG